MAKYKVIGARTVAGRKPGATVELDLPEANIDALVAAGHIAPARRPTPTTGAAPEGTDEDALKVLRDLAAADTPKES